MLSKGFSEAGIRIALCASEMKSESAIRNLSLFARIALLFAIGLPAILILQGCCDDCKEKTVYEDVIVVDNLPPTPPDGVYSVTGDKMVTIYWNPNREPDLAGYGVYFNYDGGNLYHLLADLPADQNWYEDRNLVNGKTKYYAISAYDIEGLESELSYEDVFDTPRPEGINLVLYDYLGQNSALSGYDFASLSGVAQPWNDPTTDIYFGMPNGEYTLFVDSAGVDIQDYGYVESLDEVDWAPLNGWAPQKKVPLVPGHSYIVRILGGSGSYNFAKIYARELIPGQVTLDWAYQTDPDNPELVQRRDGSSPGEGRQK